jgi:hypothetical protein
MPFILEIFPLDEFHYGFIALAILQPAGFSGYFRIKKDGNDM